MVGESSQSDYTLILCEKPDAARKVADALAHGRVTSVRLNKVEVLKFERNNEPYVVCSAVGHLYRISDSFPHRDTFPVYDLEWYPVNLLEKSSRNVRTRIAVIERLSKNAKKFVNACDYDAEGETIADNILRYACGAKETVALRAKFSTLTREELTAAFDTAEVGTALRLFDSGRARHTLDFIWGINISRALSMAADTGSSYKTISMGRVQGPTLAFVVQREIEIRKFVPVPYWTVTGQFEKDALRFVAPSLKGKFATKADAESVVAGCLGHHGVVSEIAKNVFKEPPLPPFNTGELQKEAYRLYRYSPTRTLQIAERLYLDALISYPRTSSQKLPPSIGYRIILSGLAQSDEYAEFSKELLDGPLAPKEGEKRDPAHPAIYPTGSRLRTSRSPQEKNIFDLIVRRFLACFGQDAVRERVTLTINVDGAFFGLSAKNTLRLGWMRYYRSHLQSNETTLPKIAKGDMLMVVGVDCNERLESAPPRYNQASLLDRMEKEGIGTKSTRAEIVSTLTSRTYISGDPFEATDLGITVVEKMREYCPEIVSVELTRETEKELEEIEENQRDCSDVLEGVISTISRQIEYLKFNEKELGGEINLAVTSTKVALNIIGPCPSCKTGNLLVIRSRKTGKRFVGCTNYPGCKTSAPLPQRGSIRAAAKPCAKCGWPVVYVRRGRFPWRLCVNLICESKKNAV